MAEYIEREALIKKLNEAPAYFDSGDIRYGIDIATSEVIKQPIADVVEVKHSKWKVDVYGKNKNFRDVICPICGVNYACHTGMLQLQRFSYCPNCGAKMDGSGDING